MSQQAYFQYLDISHQGAENPYPRLRCLELDSECTVPYLVLLPAAEDQVPVLSS